jgi:hypothetical protein
MGTRRLLLVAAVGMVGCFMMSGVASAAEVGPTPPWHVVATQGSTARPYVLVTWNLSDASARSYRIMRNGKRIATVRVAGDRWNDLRYRDDHVKPSTTYRYAVRAVRADGEAGPVSRPSTVEVLGTTDFGSGRVFDVDAFPGTDLERARAAVAAARAAGGGVVRFGARTYTFDNYLLLSATDNIVLRGAGHSRTFIQPSFTGMAEACGLAASLIVVRSRRATLPISSQEPIEVGERSVRVDSTASLSVGRVVVFDQSQLQRGPMTHAANGVIQDPGRGADHRYPWDANEIVGIDGATVTFKYPFSQTFTTEVGWHVIERGYGNRIERLTLQGRGYEERSHYQLLTLDHVADFTLADVRMRWANRNYVQVNGFDVKIVGFRGPYGGAKSYDLASCKYKITIFRAANVSIVGSIFGSPKHNKNQSYVTVQKAQRIMVRQSRFYGTRTYALNEHGGGSRDLIFENNLIAAGAKAHYGGILLGNNAWGFGGPTIIRNSLFIRNRRDLYIQENSYEVRFLQNTSRRNTYRLIDAYGWAGPNTPPQYYGSLRLTIRGNEATRGSGDGVVLGEPASPWFPYLGVRDVIVLGNRLGVGGARLRVLGTPERVVLDARSVAATERPPWSQPFLGWEEFDGSS